MPKIRRLMQWSWTGIANNGSRRCDAPLKPDASGFRHCRKENGILICDRFAKYRVDRRYMCRKHAALYVLDRLDPSALDQ